MYSAQRGYGVQYVPAPARDFIVDGRARLRLAVNKPRSLYRLCATSVHAPPRTRRGRMARESAPPIVRTGFAKSRCGAGYWATRREPRVRRCQNVHAADQAVGRRAGRRRTSRRCILSRASSESGSGGNRAAACVTQTACPAQRARLSDVSPSSASARGRAIDSVRGYSAGRAGGVKRLTA